MSRFATQVARVVEGAVKSSARDDESHEGSIEAATCRDVDAIGVRFAMNDMSIT